MSLADDLLSAFINFDACYSDASSEPEESVHLHQDSTSSCFQDPLPQFFDILNPYLLSSERSEEVSLDPTSLPESTAIRSSQSLLFFVDPTTIYPPACLDTPSPLSEESTSDLVSDSDSTYSSLRSGPLSPSSSSVSDSEGEWRDSSPFFASSVTIEQEEGKCSSMIGDLPPSPLTRMTPATGGSPQFSLFMLPSPSFSSPLSSPLSSVPDLQEDPAIQEDYRHTEPGSSLDRTKIKLQKSRNKFRTVSLSSPQSYKPSRFKEYNQDISSPELPSSASMKAGGNRGRANRYACDACGKTFARRADIPRHMQSACSVLGKVHLPTCDLCGKTYSRLDAIRRHQRNGDCIGSVMEPPRRSGRRS